MLNLICTIVSRIVFTGLNGTSLIIPLCILLYVIGGQVNDFKMVVKQVLRVEKEKGSKGLQSQKSQ